MSEALKACPNPECQSSRVDTCARDMSSTIRTIIQGYVECWDCGVRGPMTCGYSGADAGPCTSKAKSEAARLWNAFASVMNAPPATDAGEMRERVARAVLKVLSPHESWEDFDTRLEVRGDYHLMQLQAFAITDAILALLPAKSYREGIEEAARLVDEQSKGGPHMLAGIGASIMGPKPYPELAKAIRAIGDK